MRARLTLRRPLALFDEHIPVLGVLELLGGPLRGRLDLGRHVGRQLPEYAFQPVHVGIVQSPQGNARPKYVPEDQPDMLLSYA
jgi:hypothetical protein